MIIVLGLLVVVLLVFSYTIIEMFIVNHTPTISDVDHTLTKQITVVDKTIQTNRNIFYTTSTYLILSDDNIVYHAKDWGSYSRLRINNTYTIKARLYGSSYWTIEEID